MFVHHRAHRPQACSHGRSAVHLAKMSAASDLQDISGRPVCEQFCCILLRPCILYGSLMIAGLHLTASHAAGCMAALEAEHYLSEHGLPVPAHPEAHWTSDKTAAPVANGHTSASGHSAEANKQAAASIPVLASS